MQTFLSETTFEASVAVLDGTRLQKQFLECWQILNAISITPDGGGSRVDGKVPFASNHPATNMWRGYEYQLMRYSRIVRDELRSRDIKWYTIWDMLRGTWFEGFTAKVEENQDMPGWWLDGNTQDKIIYTHRASLYNKDPEWYAQYRPFAENLDLYRDVLVCCPGKHADYHYPTHVKD